MYAQVFSIEKQGGTEKEKERGGGGREGGRRERKGGRREREKGKEGMSE